MREPRHRAGSRASRVLGDSGDLPHRPARFRPRRERGTLALADAERLVALDPQDARSYYARGVALAKLGRDREALADFDDALRRRPELVYPLGARADARERLCDPARAAADRAEAARKQAEHPAYAVCLDTFRY